VKNVLLVKSTEVEVKPFILNDFICQHETGPQYGAVSKKEIKQLAKEIGLGHTDDQIHFAKKIITAYLAQK
jgi:hypothetical protein